MKRASIEYDAQGAARKLASIAARPLGFAAEERLTSARLSELPVFVVGMPRSGSSLVEQIIAAHPDVHGAGERTRLRGSFEASAAQVRRPIYRTSVGRAAAVIAHLEPLTEALGELIA